MHRSTTDSHIVCIQTTTVTSTTVMKRFAAAWLINCVLQELGPAFGVELHFRSIASREAPVCVLRGACWSSGEKRFSPTVHTEYHSNETLPLCGVNEDSDVKGDCTHAIHRRPFGYKHNVIKRVSCESRTTGLRPLPDKTCGNAILVSNAYWALKNLYHAFALVYIPLFTVLKELLQSECTVIVDVAKRDVVDFRIVNFMYIFGQVHYLQPSIPICCKQIVAGIPAKKYLIDEASITKAGVKKSSFLAFKNFVQESVRNQSSYNVQPSTPLVLVEQRKRNRRFLNLEDTVRVIQKTGFQVHLLPSGSLELSEQIRIVQRAAVILGAHGAFQTLGAFATADALVIEIQPYRFNTTNPRHASIYQTWATLFNYKLKVLYSLPNGHPTLDGRKSMIVVPLLELRTILQHRYQSISEGGHN